MKQQPNYFSILTANVRYDPRLKHHADCKVLFSEITALANKNGYCTASNGYFAELYDRPKPTISRWINLLKKLGYIKVVMVYVDNTKQIKRRKLYPVADSKQQQKETPINAKSNTPINPEINTINTDVKTPINVNVKTPINADVKGNNTSNNNTSNNKYIYSRQSGTNDNPITKKQDNPVKQVIDYLNQKTGRTSKRDQFSYKTKQYKTLINARFKDGYTLDDFKQVIDNKCAEWLHDPEMVNYLRPSTLFRPVNFDQYLKQKTAKPRIRSQGKTVEHGTDWSKKKAKTSDDIMSDAEMDAIFNNFGGAGSDNS